MIDQMPEQPLTPVLDEIEKAWVRPRRGSISRNAQGHEIWYEKFAWSYVPCHWKGGALLVLIVAGANASLWLAIWLMGATGDSGPPLTAFLTLVPWFALMFWMAQRHSGPRR